MTARILPFAPPDRDLDLNFRAVLEPDGPLEPPPDGPTRPRMTLAAAEPVFGHHVDHQALTALLDAPGAVLVVRLGDHDTAELLARDGAPRWPRAVQHGPGAIAYRRQRFDWATSVLYDPARGVAFPGSTYTSPPGMQVRDAADIGRLLNRSTSPPPPTAPGEIQLHLLAELGQFAPECFPGGDPRRLPDFYLDSDSLPDGCAEMVRAKRALADALGIELSDPRLDPRPAPPTSGRPAPTCPGPTRRGGKVEHCEHYEQIPDDAELAAALPGDGTPWPQNDLIAGLLQARGCACSGSDPIRAELSRSAAARRNAPDGCGPDPHVHTSLKPGRARMWWRCVR